MKPALLLLAAGVLGAGGCANNDLSIAITQFEAITTMTSCVAMAGGAGTVGLSRGTLDVSLVTTQGYIAVPVVRNNLTMATGGGNIQFNSVDIVGANVSLQTAAGVPLTLPTGQQSFFYPANGGRLDPGGSTPLFVEVLRADVAKSMANMIPANGVFTVVANLRPVGMHSTDQIIGANAPFPIDLCQGCLLKNSKCPLPKGSTPMNTCFPQQDVVNTCCTDAAGNLLCGTSAPVATM